MNTGLWVTEIFHFASNHSIVLPLFLTPVRAGFPSPAADWIDSNLDINQYIVQHPSASFYLRVEGSSMLGAGIHPGDLILVDRSIKPQNNQVIIALVNGEFTVKRLRKTSSGRIFLMADNPDYAPIEINSEMGFEVWGVVTHVIHSV